MKAFLSHSSSNKAYVGRIFEYLSAARAHYDSVTFDSFQRNFDAIRTAMADSDLFVFFASSEALASDWVKEEIKLSVDPATLGRRLERIVVLLGADRSDLPPELAQCTAISYADPSLVARKIEGLLTELRVKQGLKKLFVGREDDLKSISSGLIPVADRAPEFLFVSGIPGIGRKTVLSRSVQDNFPFINQTLKVVPVTTGTTTSDLYFRIRSDSAAGTVAEFAREVDRYNALSSDDQLTELAELMARQTRERDPIVLDDGAWLIADSGDLAPWFLDVLGRMPERPYPQVIIVSGRSLSPSGRAALGKRYFAYSLSSLSKQSSSRLLWLHLQQAGTAIDSTTLAALVDAVDGHPDQIVRAASLIIGGQSVGADLRIKEVIEALNRSAESLIKLARLTDDQFLVVKLFNEFEFMTAEDIAAAFEEAGRFEHAFFPLLEFSFIERVGEFFRLAPSISRALVRIADKEVDIEAFVALRRAIASRLSRISGEDLVDFDVLEKSVEAWVRSNDADPPLLAAKMLLPASLLRCARRAYDARDWGAAADFSGRALDGAWKLSDEAALEAYRLRGLSLARRNDPAFDDLLASLRREERFCGQNSKVAQRTTRFLHAFKSRLDGEYEEARKELELILKDDRRPSFNVLREYSAVLMKLGEIDEALVYSRKALEMAGSNPFVLAMLIDILDRKAAREGYTQELSAERRSLFERLKRADETDRTSFSLLREARQCARDKDYRRAMALLDTADSERDADPIVLSLERAQVFLSQGNYEAAIKAADKARRTAVSTLAGRAVEYFAQVDEIRIRALLEQGSVGEAESLLREARRLDTHAREELTRLVGFSRARR